MGKQTQSNNHATAKETAGTETSAHIFMTPISPALNMKP